MQEEYLLITLPGLEKIVALEAKKKNLEVISSNVYGSVARVLVKGSPLKIRSMRTIESAMLVLKTVNLRDTSLTNLRYSIRTFFREATSLKELLKSARSLSVRCSLSGIKGEVDKKSLERIIAREAVRVFPHLKVLPGVGDIRIRVEVFLRARKIIFGMDIAPIQPMHRRPYAMMRHPTMLSPLIAAAVAYLINPRGFAIAYDPFCGSGTIPIELAIIHNNLEVMASDISHEYVSKAKINAKYAGVQGKIRFFVCDIKNISARPHSVNFIITDPPRERRKGMDPNVLIEAMLRACDQLLIEKGEVIVISPFEMIIRAIAMKYSFSIISNMRTVQGGMKVSIIKLMKSA